MSDVTVPFLFMVKKDFEDRPVRVIRLTVDEDHKILGQQLLTVNGWLSWPDIEWTGAGGATEWEPISAADVIPYLPEGVEIDGQGEVKT